jgi:hypothetical protein
MFLASSTQENHRRSDTNHKSTRSSEIPFDLAVRLLGFHSLCANMGSLNENAGKCQAIAERGKKLGHSNFHVSEPSSPGSTIADEFAEPEPEVTCLVGSV